ncbi:hypothetical protein JCGZ_14852 [Jatropha curcas]|uniref:Uncharacterized protein n=1 Tax=Jatropha curcas TaxID=180498 RepID=A0A067K664_JATCU|nr:hypothetical protein JCGZ_14852 [Jatropha curcas]
MSKCYTISLMMNLPKTWIRGWCKARGRKEYVWIADVPSNINEGKLLDVCFTYNLSLEYNLIRPSESMGVIEPLDEDSIIMLLCAIIALARQDEYNMIARTFQDLYHFPVHPNEDHCFLQAKNNYDIFAKKSKISFLKNWKSKYFIVKHPGELIKARGLVCVNLRQVIAEGYPTCSSSGPMRPNPSIHEMAPKKSKSSKMAKVAEAMKKKAATEGSGKEVPSVVPDTQPTGVDTSTGAPQSKLPPLSPTKYGANCSLQEEGPSREISRNCLFPIDTRYYDHLDDVAMRDLLNQCLFQAINANKMYFSRISKLKARYTEMEVKNQMEDALKDAEVSMKEQEAQHKAEITAREAKIDKLREESWDLLNKNKELESKVKEMDGEL